MNNTDGNDRTAYWVSAAVLLLIIVIGTAVWYNATAPEPYKEATSTVKLIATSTVPMTEHEMVCGEKTERLNAEALNIQSECVDPSVSKECEDRSHTLYQEIADFLKECDTTQG